jgi:hypothetical protein
MEQGVTTQMTRRNVSSIIGAWMTHQGVAFESNGPGFVVDGERLTPGQAAERYVPGGWDTAWVRREMPPTA